MDSQASLARSPPQFSKDLVSTAIIDYKALLKQIASKSKAVQKLQVKTPKSIQHNIDLKLPPAVRDTRPNLASELQQRFNAAIQASQATMRDVILEAAMAELELLLEARRDFKIAYERKLYEYFEKVFGQVRQIVCTDATIKFAPALPDEAPALLHTTVRDLNLSVTFLHDSLGRIDYEDILATTLREQRQVDSLAS